MKHLTVLLCLSVLLVACERTLPVQTPTVPTFEDRYLVSTPWRKLSHCMDDYLKEHMVFGELRNRSDVSFRPDYAGDGVTILVMHASTRIASVRITALDHSQSEIIVKSFTDDRLFLTKPTRNYARNGVQACSA